MKKIAALLTIIIMCARPLMAAQLFDVNQQEDTNTTSDSIIVDILEKQNVKFTTDNSITLLTSGKEKFEDMFKAIRQAKSSIHLEYFNFRNDSIAFALFDLLAEKAKEGVEVRALFDAFGNASNNQPLKNHHIKELRDRGIQIYKFDPIRFPWVNHVFARDHRKIVVIDGKIAYTGGMNVADYYINGTPEVGKWRDMHCRVDGSAVNDLQKIFVETWNATTGDTLHGAKYYRGIDNGGYFNGLKPDTSATAGHKMAGIANREPEVSNKIARILYTEGINAAKDSIKIINPYMTLNHKLKKALKNAVKRGVKVDILVGAKSDIPLTPDAMYYALHKLMKKGCTVWLYEDGFHHSKTMTVDGRFCTLGSINLDARSLRWDREVNTVIIDRSTTCELDSLFIDDTKHSFKLTEESWKKFRTPWKRFVGWFAHLLTPFL